MSKKKEKERAESKSSKPKPQAETQNQQQLLFINTGSSNLNPTPEDVYAINSHVSKASRKWKRTGSYLDLDTSTSRILGDTDIEPESIPRSSKSTATISPPGEALSLRWRMHDGKVISSEIFGAKSSAKAPSMSSPSASASAVALASRLNKEVTLSSEATSSQGTMAPTMPLSLPSSEENVRVIHYLLGIYFQRIRPAVFSISRSWIWVEDSTFILSSPVLTYAICAFTSAFAIGAQHGLDKLCIPPQTTISPQIQEPIKDPLWPIPIWFLFQAHTISLLRQRLSLPSDPARPIPKAELHAILFLMRLHVLLGNQEVAYMHMSAISSATENAAILPDLRIDSAMWRVNFVLALMYPSAIRIRPYVPAVIHTQQEPLLDVDPLALTDSNARRKVYRLLMDRSLLWTCMYPFTMSVPQASETLVQDHMGIDAEGIAVLQSSDTQQLRVCLLIARYLFAYLRYIDGDTTLANIRQLVPGLQSRLSVLLESQGPSVDLLWRRLPRTLTYLFVAGAFASRGVDNIRTWFIRHVCRGLELQILTTFEDMTMAVDGFLGLETVREVLLVEIWSEVLKQASGDIGGSGEGG